MGFFQQNTLVPDMENTKPPCCCGLVFDPNPKPPKDQDTDGDDHRMVHTSTTFRRHQVIGALMFVHMPRPRVEVMASWLVDHGIHRDFTGHLRTKTMQLCMQKPPP